MSFFDPCIIAYPQVQEGGGGAAVAVPVVETQGGLTRPLRRKRRRLSDSVKVLLKEWLELKL